jgi:hypothetical protein
MRRQILIAIVMIGKSPIKISDLTEDQKMGILNDELAQVVDNHTMYMILTPKGLRIYDALEAVVGTVTKW